MRCPAAPSRTVPDGGIVPKKDITPALADRVTGHGQKRHLRNPQNASMREPHPRNSVPTDLELPVWLPLGIARHVQQNHSRITSDDPLLRRLISDPRMERVWTELLKRKRSNHKSSQAFKYPATSRIDWDPIVRGRLRRAQTVRRTSRPENEREANKIEIGAKLSWAAEDVIWNQYKLSTQEHALLAFFSQAFEFARTESKPVPRAVAQKKRAHFLDMAGRIRTDLLSLDSPYDGQALIDAAFKYEELADKKAPPPGHPLLVQRERRRDPRQTAFVIELVDAAMAIFGQPLYGVVSILTNVAFECEDWTDNGVRKVTKGARPLPQRTTIGP
jgi:hypothetical protein